MKNTFLGSIAQVLILFILVAGVSAPRATGEVMIDWVTVGNAGNDPQSPTNRDHGDSGGDGHGAVAHEYRIARNETTIAQYTEFLNAKAKSDPYGLWSSTMSSDLRIAGIDRSGADGSYVYSVVGNGDRPIASVDWFQCARFVNWLHNGQGAGDTESGAYNLGGEGSDGVFEKQPGASFWIPSEDEWFKAAYYDPTKNGGAGGYWRFATRSDVLNSNTVGVSGAANYFDGDYVGSGTSSLPTGNALTVVGAYGAGSMSYYGTNDQTGSLGEWNDSVSTSGTARGQRGGSWLTSGGAVLLSSGRRFSMGPGSNSIAVGFRVAGIEDPGPVEPSGGIEFLQSAANELTVNFKNFSFAAEEDYTGSFLSIAFPEIFSEAGAMQNFVSGNASSQTLEVRVNGGSWLSPSSITFNLGSFFNNRQISFNMTLDGDLIATAGDAVEVRGLIIAQDAGVVYPDLINTTMPVTIGPGFAGGPPIFDGIHPVIGPITDYLVNFGAIDVSDGQWNNIAAAEMNSGQFINLTDRNGFDNGVRFRAYPGQVPVIDASASFPAIPATWNGGVSKEWMEPVAARDFVWLSEGNEYFFEIEGLDPAKAYRVEFFAGWNEGSTRVYRAAIDSGGSINRALYDVNGTQDAAYFGNPQNGLLVEAEGWDNANWIVFDDIAIGGSKTGPGADPDDMLFFMDSMVNAIRITESVTGFDSVWQGSTVPVSLRGFEDDANGDDVPNGIAYALGIPLEGTPTAEDRSRLPAVAASQTGGPSALGFGLPTEVPEDVTYIIQVSKDLSGSETGWTEVARKTGTAPWTGAVASTISSDDSTPGVVRTTVEYPSTYTSSPCGFMRLVVEQANP